MCDDRKWKDAVAMVGKKEATRRLLRPEELEAPPLSTEKETVEDIRNAYLWRISIDSLCARIMTLPMGILK